VIWFEGEVQEREDESLLVGLSANEGSRIRCFQNGEDLEKGDPVVVAVRPEEVKLQRESSGNGLNRVSCEVEAAVFLGDRYECHLRWGELSFTLSTPRSEQLVPGHKVSLQLSPQSVHVWHRCNRQSLNLKSPFKDTRNP
jgi:ABC-type Fe3+/spermidine/putrescine transport system ATPase subunit